LAVGVFKIGWGEVFGWQQPALTLDVGSAGAACLKAPQVSFGRQFVNNANPMRGSAVVLSATVSASCQTNALVTLNLYNAAGTRVAHWSLGTLTLGPTGTGLRSTWPVPSRLALGSYRADVLVLDPSGRVLYGSGTVARLQIGKVVP
jgi:hypothetical protein